MKNSGKLFILGFALSSLILTSGCSKKENEKKDPPNKQETKKESGKKPPKRLVPPKKSGQGTTTPKPEPEKTKPEAAPVETKPEPAKTPIPSEAGAEVEPGESKSVPLPTRKPTHPNASKTPPKGGTPPKTEEKKKTCPDGKKPDPKTSKCPDVQKPAPKPAPKKPDPKPAPKKPAPKSVEIDTSKIKPLAELELKDPAAPECERKKDGDIIKEEKGVDRAKKSPQHLFATRVVDLKPKRDVRMVKLLYCTPGVSKKLVPASGTVFIPMEKGAPVKGPLSVISAQHAAEGIRTDSPSNLNGKKAIAFSLVASASEFVVSAPDFIGLGNSKMQHAYLHARTEASSAISLLIALKNLKGTPLQLSNDLYIGGYSQGGHATLALQKRLEKSSHGYNLKASAPMAGPYDLVGIGLEQTIKAPSVMTPFYTAFTIVGMQEAYGVFESLDKAFKPKYLEKVVSYFKSAEKDGSELASALPKTVEELVTPELFKALKERDPENLFIRALKTNSDFNWKPKTPTRFFHTENDDRISPKNSLVAVEKMKKLAPKKVLFTNLGKVPTKTHGSHGNGMASALKASIKWFMTIRSKNSVTEQGPGGENAGGDDFSKIDY